MESNSSCVGHEPCPSCGSRDNLARYDDGHGYCFGCQHYEPGRGEPQPERKTRMTFKPLTGEFQDLIKRRINEKTCEKFGYRVGRDEEGNAVQIADYRDERGQLVGQKVRKAGKEFYINGSISDTLYGKHLWREGGKRIVITEGEIDAMSVAQAMNLSWPVVSIPNGSGGAKKAIQKNLDWLSRYETVVLMFDEDEPGRKAAAECADLFEPGKCAVATLPLKDANEMLQAGRVGEITKAVWEAQVRRPDGIVNGKDLWDDVNTVVEMGVPYPFAGLNTKLFGLRPREIVTLTAGTGIGKSSVCAEIAYHLMTQQNQPVGYVALEESKGRTGLRFMGIHMNKPIHLPGFAITPEERRAAFDATLGTGKLWTYDHFGSLDTDNLLAKLRYLVKGCGVPYLVLDHLSIVVSGMDLEGDERRAIDNTMTRLRQFTEETDAGLILVSHLKRPEGRGHEEGAATSLSQLRGSAAIAQLSDAVIGLERPQQAGDESANDMIVRILKNRYAGTTGICSVLRYNPETGRLTEVPFALDENGEVATEGSDDGGF
jgi:twinkle protein